MSASFIFHNGRKIIYSDYSNCKTPQETIEVLEKVRNFYLPLNERHLALNNFSNAPVSNEFLDLAKKYGKEVFDSRTLKESCFGLSSMKKILLNVYNITVKNKLVPFDTREQALEYLMKE